MYVRPIVFFGGTGGVFFFFCLCWCFPQDFSLRDMNECYVVLGGDLCFSNLDREGCPPACRVASICLVNLFMQGDDTCTHSTVYPFVYTGEKKVCF